MQAQSSMAPQSQWRSVRNRGALYFYAASALQGHKSVLGVHLNGAFALIKFIGSLLLWGGHSRSIRRFRSWTICTTTKHRLVGQDSRWIWRLPHHSARLISVPICIETNTIRWHCHGGAWPIGSLWIMRAIRRSCGHGGLPVPWFLAYWTAVQRQITPTNPSWFRLDFW